MKLACSYKKSSFGPAFFFLKKRQREALTHYYEFCRLADDITDEPGHPNPQQELKELGQEVQYIYIGAPTTSLGQALVPDVLSFQLPIDRFTLLLEGMNADVDKKTYATFDELDWYLYRVAVIVGKATLDILGVTGVQADELAKNLGTAVQLTNIIRDVYEDAKMGRVYLPCSFSAQEILEHPEIIRPLLTQAADRAKQRYAHAFALMKAFGPFVMLPCRIMGYIYQKNLAKIEETGFSFIDPIRLNKKEKRNCVGYAIIKTFF